MKKYGTYLLERINPTRNAVVIDFFETTIGKEIERVISIECKDKHLYKTMKDYALNIIGRGEGLD